MNLPSIKKVHKLRIEQSKTHNLAGKIRYLADRRKTTESEIAASLNLPVMTIRRILSGETSDPRISTLKLLADYFNVPLDYLVDEANVPPEHISGLSKLLPMIDWETLNTKGSINAIDMDSWTNWMPLSIKSNKKLGKNSFCIETIRSMQPRFPTGTILVVDPDEKPIDGDLILIKDKNTEIHSIVELIIDLSKKQIRSISGADAIKYDEEKYIIIGIITLSIYFERK